MIASTLRRTAPVLGRRGVASLSSQSTSTLSGRVKGLMQEYGKPWLAIGGLFGSAAIVNPTAAVCVGSMFAAVHVADLAVNKDLDDLNPRWLLTRLRGPAESRQRIVVLGSGWGAIAFARKLDPMDFDVTIVSPRNYFFYTPMLAGVTTGTVKASSVLEAVRQVQPMPHATYLQAECTGVDPDTKVLHCQGSEICLDVPYDKLVVAVGAQPNTFGIPGVQEHAMFLKELDHGLAVRKQILEKMELANLALQAGRASEAEKLLSVVVVGGGPTGVEFAAEVADFINNDVRRSFPNIVDKMRVTLVEALPQLLPMFGGSIGEGVSKHLSSVGVNVRTETMVKNVDTDTLSLGTKSGEDKSLDYGVLVWVAGIGARPITKTLAAAFGQSNPRGIEVDEKLCVKGANGGDVFAFGDCAVSGNPLTAQVAAQQGKYLGHMFRNGGASASTPFAYDHQGTMAYVGKGEGVAELTVPTADFSFWRQLATCPQGWLKEEHRTLPVEKPDTWKITVMGMGGFAIWRGVYFIKLFSYSNRFNVATDWVRNLFFGRVIASSVQSRM